MKELDLATVVAVFEEMLGWTLWALVALAALATLAFLYVLLRDRGVVARRLVWAEAFGVLGGAGAVMLMFAVTNSGLRDLGGPVDWLLVVGIFAAGLVGTAIGLYALFGLFAGAPRRVSERAKAAPARA